MPGSRKQEISRILPKMITATEKYTDYQLVIAAAPSIDKNFYAPYLNERVSIVYNETYDVLHQSTAAVVCSGTATLETALFKIPQVCGYAASEITYQIAMMVIRVPYISLVNLCLNRECIKELLQRQFNVHNLTAELDSILPGGNNRQRMLNDYIELEEILGGVGASERAATEIMLMGNS